MIKRITAYCFLVLANILLLTHAVVPHHHHQHLICFDKEHCAHDGLPLEHGQRERDHQHDNNHIPNPCLLSEYVVSASDHIFRLSGNQINADNCLYILWDSFFSGRATLSSPPTGIISFAPYLVPLYSSFSYPPWDSRPPPSC